MSSFHRLLCTLGLLAGTGASVQASGTYPPAPPRLPSEVLKSIDAEQYNLGKAVFTGRATTAETAQGSPAEQEARREKLASLLARLPERVRASTDLMDAASRLSDREADAVIYYAIRRFSLTEAAD